MGKRLIHLDSTIIGAASVVGKEEHRGPLGKTFDMHDEDDRFGQTTWERAESEMQRRALALALNKTKISEEEIDALFAGDLLNQCVASAYGLMDYNIPYFGLYGACSTSVEGMILAAALHTGGLCRRCAVVSSSHNCSAERQYRAPIEYGSQRAPTAQWTVTGAGAFLIGDGGSVRIRAAMAGIVVEKGISDAANMGAAMAPAVVNTLVRYFSESGTAPSDYDLIVTGDLGYEGGSLLCEMMLAEGYDIRNRYNDCGMMIYSRGTQDKHAGGSGCGCAASVTASYLLPKLERGELRNILLIATGAMMSPSSVMQGDAIPAVAHLVNLCTTYRGRSDKPPLSTKQQ
ncbi:MAG: stage V sporulation protein AD [Clostridia bacterium]|nr:stage V sporulation protein AD [Clostridia bacterium]